MNLQAAPPYGLFFACPRKSVFGPHKPEKTSGIVAQREFTGDKNYAAIFSSLAVVVC